MRRYTVTGSLALEATIDAQLAAIRADLLARAPRGSVDCLVLGGGYGRGEGGALRDPSGAEHPYNDYDLVLVHGTLRRGALRAAIRSVEEEHSRRTGLHVDVTPLHRRRLDTLPPALTWYELGRGHRVLYGSPAHIAPLTRRRLRGVHPSEWGRLTMNRAMGLVLARWVLRGEPCPLLGAEVPDAFVTRQLQKAWLALGDVWLAERGLYHHLVRRRRDRFAHETRERPPWADAYERAVDFKLSPSGPLSLAEQREQLGELSRLYVPRLLRKKASPLRPAVGLLATLRDLPRRRWLAAPPWAYPRERIRQALAAELCDRRERLVELTDSTEALLNLWSRYG